MMSSQNNKVIRDDIISGRQRKHLLCLLWFMSLLSRERNIQHNCSLSKSSGVRHSVGAREGIFYRDHWCDSKKSIGYNTVKNVLRAVKASTIITR